VLLGSSDLLAVGEEGLRRQVRWGLERTVDGRLLSTKTREFQGELYLQTTAQINPGNSGGPLSTWAARWSASRTWKILSAKGSGSRFLLKR